MPKNTPGLVQFAPLVIEQVATGVIAVFGTLFASLPGTSLDTLIQELLEESANGPNTNTDVFTQTEEFFSCFETSLTDDDGCGCMRIEDFADKMDDLREQMETTREHVESAINLDAFSVCSRVKDALRQIIEGTFLDFSELVQSKILCRPPPSQRKPYSKELKLRGTCKTYADDSHWWQDPVTKNLCTICAGRYAQQAGDDVFNNSAKFMLMFLLLQKLKCGSANDRSALRNDYCKLVGQIASCFSLGKCPKKCLAWEFAPKYVNVPKAD